jgi:DNA gyrase subunit A
MQSTFNLNMLALVDGQPRVLSLKEVLQHHIDYRRDVIKRRTEFDLKKAKERAHILEGLKIAHANLDAIIKLIRAHRGQESLLIGKMHEQFGLSEAQAKAILDMQLRRLSALEREKLEEETRPRSSYPSRVDPRVATQGARTYQGRPRHAAEKYGDERRRRSLTTCRASSPTSSCRRR